ncbi:MAG: GNAT family N-acetyltransferase [Planctomycetaceae bacterium]
MTTVLQTLSPPGSPVHPAASRTSSRTAHDWRVLSSQNRDEALALWQQVEARCEALNKAQQAIPLVVSNDWTRIWLNHYGDVVPHEFLVLSDTQGPAGITLLTTGQGRGFGPFREKTRHLGTAGEKQGESVCVEYNHLLVVPSLRMPFQEQIVTYVLQDKSWESFRLDGFIESEATGLRQELPGFEVRLRPSPYYNLQAARTAGCDPLDRLGRSTRQNLRRLLRKYGEIEVSWAESIDEAHDIFQELVTLHQARWQSVGQPGAFHSRRFAAFQKELVETSFANRSSRRRIVLLRARTREQTIGCLLLLIDGPRLLDYLSGFADFNVAPSPGLVTHALGIQAALARGYEAYDFLVGEKRHKENLSTDVNQLVWATWRRTTLRSRTVGTLRRLKRRWTEIRRGEAYTSSAAPAT